MGYTLLLFVIGESLREWRWRGYSERFKILRRGKAMRYLISVIDDTTNSATGDEMEAIDVFNEKLRANNHWVLACGIGSPDTATVIDNRDGRSLFSSGPFLESKEYVAGFWLIDAPSGEEALKLAAEGSNACNRKVEVRPLLVG